jgi:hypothetical protein
MTPNILDEPNVFINRVKLIDCVILKFCSTYLLQDEISLAFPQLKKLINSSFDLS